MNKQDSLPLIISEQDIASVLNYEELIDVMRDALIDYSSGKVIQPDREMLPVEPQLRYFAAMPAATENIMGAKLVSFFPKNAAKNIHTHLAMIVLFDVEEGQPLAVMDGRLITEMRTAAVSAAITKKIVSPKAQSLALVGSGVQARAHLEALKTIFPLKDIRVWSRNFENAELFASRNGARALSLSDAVMDAEIVVCATASLEPVLQGNWISQGTHVNSVGSPRPDWRELDDETVANTVIVDSRSATMKESGDIIMSGAKVFAEAGEILNGDLAVEKNTTTVFKSVGLAIEDIAAARMVYEKLCG